jgi:hypothetical protein
MLIIMNFEMIFENIALVTNDKEMESITLYSDSTQSSVTIISTRTALNATKIYDNGRRKFPKCPSY